MKKPGFIISLLFVCIKTNAREILKDSLKEKPRVLCSFFLNTAAGNQQFRDNPDGKIYRERSPDTRITFPIDIRIYFFKNHLGLGYSKFKTVGSYNRYEAYNPFAIVHKGKKSRDVGYFYMSYNFNLRPLETERLAPYFQINHAVSFEPVLVMAFGTIGVQYKLTNFLALNAALSGGYGTGGGKYEANIGLCFRAVEKKREHKESRSIQKQDSIKWKGRILLELGAGYNNAEQQSLTFYNYDKYFVDTVNYYKNDLLVIKHAFPSIGLGYMKNNQSFQIEYSGVNYRSANKITSSSFINMNESTSDSYVSIGYYLNDVAGFTKYKKESKFQLYAGIKLCDEWKKRNIGVSGYLTAGDYRTFETYYLFKSNTIRLLLESGIKYNLNDHFYTRFGFSLNSIGYHHGTYNLIDQYTPTFGPDTSTKTRIMSRKYDQLLFIGNHETARLFHNFFLKIGYSF
jgi:hypothetical protein